MSPGDKITCAVYLDDGSTFIVRTRFQEQSATLYTSAEVTVGINEFVLDCVDRDEGVYWIRGWPDLASEEVTAMLAAFALAGERGSSLLFGYDDYEDDYSWEGWWWSGDPYWDDNFVPQGLVR